MMYSVLEYTQVYDTTKIRNLRRMGFRNLDTAANWAKKCQFAEIRESSPSGAICIGVVINHRLTWRRNF